MSFATNAVIACAEKDKHCTEGASTRAQQNNRCTAGHAPYQLHHQALGGVQIPRLGQERKPQGNQCGEKDEPLDYTEHTSVLNDIYPGICASTTLNKANLTTKHL